MCSSSGRRVWTFRNLVVKAIKARFPPHTNERSDLLQGSKVICRLCPKPIGGDADGEDISLFWGLEPRFLHLAEVALSPWSFWVQELTEVSDEGEIVSANASEDETALKARAEG